MIPGFQTIFSPASPMKMLSVCLLLMTALIGCGESTAVQTVEWYKDHNAERKEILVKCNNNLGELTKSPNCVNAQQAENEKGNARRGWLKPGKAE
jgi:predicted Fe-S protein YdhL (DUF1289 family)